MYASWLAFNVSYYLAGLGLSSIWSSINYTPLYLRLGQTSPIPFFSTLFLFSFQPPVNSCCRHPFTNY